MKHLVNYSCVLLTTGSILFFTPTSTSAASFMGLGDLPGGDIESTANAVSADGLVVVGESESANDREAFRWTAGEGMIGLGDLTGDDFFESKAWQCPQTDRSLWVRDSAPP